jgi:hypothetical protein
LGCYWVIKIKKSHIASLIQKFKKELVNKTAEESTKYQNLVSSHEAILERMNNTDYGIKAVALYSKIN